MIDARGLICPMPAAMVLKEVKANRPNTIEVSVDDACAVENITRIANNNGYTIQTEELGSEWKLILQKK